MSYDSQTSSTLINKLRKDVDSLTLKVAVLTDSKTSGTSGGTGVATTWSTRTLNTIAVDPNGLILQLESNTFKLAAGAYQIRAMAAFRHTGHTRMRIYDVTASAEPPVVDVIVGYSVSSEVSNQANTYIDLNLRVQPHKDNVYRLEYYISAAGADHLGIPTSLANIDEIFAICEIIRLDTGLTKPSGGSGIQGAPGPAGPAGPAGPPGPAGGGTVTNVSVVTANGVSGSVATSTTTPAITLALGAITPTSVAASGAISAGATVTGSNLSGVNTGDQVIILSGDRMLTEGSDFLITESGDYILETGDVTGQGTGRIPAVITPQAVTYDKMQYVSTANRLLGRGSSTGQVEEISLGSGISLAGTVLSATGNGGTVTSINADGGTSGFSFTGGPVTSSGTLSMTGTLAVASGGTGATTAPNALTNLGAYPANNPNGYNVGTVTNVTVTAANGVTASVATSTTTPAISLGLGAITPTSVASTGTVTGTNLSGTHTGTSSGTNTGDQTITLTGDVGGTGTGSFAATIAANAVTYGKIQAVGASSKLLGSSASGTAVQEITLGTNLSMTGSTLNAAGGGGGTVTSVDVAGGTTGLTTSGGPVTGSGTITLAGTLAVANGGTGLTAVGAQYQVLTSTGSAATWTTVDLNNSTSNVLPIAKGGTASITAQSAMDTLAGAQNNGQYLRGNGTNVVMSAVQAVDLPQIALGGSAVSGTLGVINGGTGLSNVYTNGDLLIGNTTGSTLNRAKITGTGIITVTNGAGTINIGATGAGSGDVVGPTSSNTDALAKFSNTTGKLIGESGWNENGGDLYGVAGYAGMTYGYVWIPSGTGTPSNPAQYGALSGRAPMYFDRNTNQLFIFNESVPGWKSVTLT